MLTAMLDSKHRGRRKGIPVREGSVRQARKEAHLSLAQVAGQMVSRTAIHLIETGRSRPSLETLEQIARQTHKPVEFFLLSPDGAPELTKRRRDLGELDRLTLMRDFQGVIDMGLTVLDKERGDEDTALVRFYLGQAYCRLVRPTDALKHLPMAREAFERVGDEWMAVDALDWEASARGLMEDPRAILLAGEALERCRRLNPKPPQTEARILGHIANMHVVAHAWAQAVGYYEAAVEAAGAMKDLLQLAKMHHGLGTAYQRMQQPTKARQQFDRALALYSIESDLSAVYRLENDLGDLLLHQGQLDAAEQHLRSALAGSTAIQMDRRGRGYILANLGEVSLRRGDLDQARQQLVEALDAGTVIGEQVVVANAHTLLGQLESRQGHLKLAGQHFDSAIRILEALEMPDRLRDCHIACAESFYEHGEIDSAALHWKAAAEIGRFASLGFRSKPETALAADELVQAVAQ
jgi:tetratricopeptide (TPR) repeat protein/DNA-binding XRE family transcriptional regulator